LAVTTNVVWEKFRDSLRRFILKRVKDEHDAEDILQDVFLKIHDNIDNLKDENRFQAWIYQIARNTVIDYYRSRKPAAELPEVPQKPADEPAADKDVTGEIVSCLNSMIDGLPELKEMLLECCHFELDRRGKILDYQPKQKPCPCCAPRSAKDPSGE
jgi:RNA polymerase sigma-70 factor (ECF subfamily)